MFPTLSSTNIGTGAPSEVRIGASAQRSCGGSIYWLS
jgi:hypothetical protein